MKDWTANGLEGQAEGVVWGAEEDRCRWSPFFTRPLGSFSLQVCPKGEMSEHCSLPAHTTSKGAKVDAVWQHARSSAACSGQILNRHKHQREGRYVRGEFRWSHRESLQPSREGKKTSSLIKVNP